MKTKTDRQKLVLMENLMLSISRLDDSVIEQSKINGLKTECDKTATNVADLREKNKDG